MHGLLLLRLGGRAAIDHSILSLAVVIHQLAWRDVSLQAAVEADVIGVLPLRLAVAAEYDVISGALVVAETLL